MKYQFPLVNKSHQKVNNCRMMTASILCDTFKTWHWKGNLYSDNFLAHLANYFQISGGIKSYCINLLLIKWHNSENLNCKNLTAFMFLHKNTIYVLSILQGKKNDGFTFSTKMYHQILLLNKSSDFVCFRNCHSLKCAKVSNMHHHLLIH